MSAARAELIHRTTVSDANTAGGVHGGWILKLLRVEAENTISDSVTHVLTAYLTTVAIDDAGAPTEVPGLIVEGPDASRRWDEPQLRREIRLAAPTDLHQLHGLLRAATPSFVA